MKKSIKILFSLLLVCTIILPFKVWAIDVDYNINAGDFTSYPSGTKSDGNEYVGNMPSAIFKGIRVTLVDNEGNRKSKSIDFFCPDASVGGNNWIQMSYSSNQRTIKEVYADVNNNYSIIKYSKLSGIGYINWDDSNTYFKNELCNGSISWSAVTQKLKQLSNGINKENTQSKNFFNLFGKEFDKSNIVDWYYMVEPVLVIGVESNSARKCTTYGTSAELTTYFSSLLAYEIGTNGVDPNSPCYNPSRFPTRKLLNWYKNPYITYEKSGDGKTIFGKGELKSTFYDNFSDGNYFGLIWLGKNAQDNENPDTPTPTEYRCESGDKKGTIISESVYKTKIHSKGRYSDVAYDQACFNAPSCQTYYMTSETFNNVKLYPEASSNTNCCVYYEGRSGNDQNELNKLYRQHPECYVCNYNESKINPTCSTDQNKATAGYTFTRNVGNTTVTADAQTCVKKSALNETSNTSSNLFTKKVVNQYCKVVCSETVSLEFPFLNNGTSAKYLTKNSVFSWPKKNNTSDNSLKLRANGNLTCWYSIQMVKLFKLFNTNSKLAETNYKQCLNDINASLSNPRNILSQSGYNLSGNFSVKYTDDSNYVNLVKEDSNVKYQNVSSKSAITKFENIKKKNVVKQSVNDFVSAAEGLQFVVSESANYVISSTGINSGYIYSYGGKYYKNKTGISSVKENNILKIEPSLALNSNSGKGSVSIVYSNIGGTSIKFIRNEQVYANMDSSNSYSKNRCTYVKTSDKTVECPNGTKNEGMNLSVIMTDESLTYNEAVEKYCNESNDMTACPSTSYYSGKPISKSCYNNETCQKLTCNIHECTDSGGTCHILNSCMTRQVEDYGKRFEEAKKICTNKYCDGKPGNIEYRVIDLKDPFPGNEAKSGFSLFNTSIKGRKPGSNWNSTTVVKNEILNNRGVSGDAIYNLEPLYEFNLTPSVIKEIRKYNDEHSYDDFTLSCKDNNKQACVANGFDFKTKFGIVKVIEQCKVISNLNKFNSCYNNDNLR